MYASNKYDRELLRVPQNYAGNAFASPRQTPGEEQATPTRGRDGVSPYVEPRTQPSAREEAALSEEASAKEGAATETTAAMAAKECEIAEEKRPPSGESGSPRGLGREELLLLGLMALTHGEREEREERGGDGRDEIGLLLMLLLLLG